MNAKPDTPARTKRAAGERIIKLYEAWGKPEKAAEWRAKLAEERASTHPAASTANTPTNVPGPGYGR